jgi:DNA repair exonuclease SbcCD nuclease subunit
MIKFLHTADVHLGIKLSGLGKSGDRVRASLKRSFSDMIDVAIEEKVDAFLIAGDLFDSNRVSNSLIRFALSEIERLGKIPCVILPGTHDCLEQGAVYLSLDENEKPDNLKIFVDPENPVIRLEDRDLTLYGMPNLSRRSKMNPISSVKRIEGDGKHVLLAHGSYMIPQKTAEDDHPFGLDDIDDSGFDYIALGHWHSYFELPTKNTKAIYCGAPETVAFDQTGAGHYLIVKLDQEVEFEKRQVGKTSWQEIELSTANFKYTIEVERELQKYVGEDRLVRVKLTGLASSETIISLDELHANLKDKFLYFDITDATSAVPDDLKKLNLPPTTILGQFINQMTDEIEKAQDPDEKALLAESLKTGFAMLSGKDVL